MKAVLMNESVKGNLKRSINMSNNFKNSKGGRGDVLHISDLKLTIVWYNGGKRA